MQKCDTFEFKRNSIKTYIKNSLGIKGIIYRFEAPLTNKFQQKLYNEKKLRGFKKF